MLESYLKEQLEKKGILLMTHIVIGYPSLDDSLRIVEEMVAAGVDLIEMQIPFSEPIADGPVILHANQMALADGIRVSQCLDFAERVCADHPIPFLFMSYCNILYRFGMEAFTDKMAELGLRGAIVPDLPPEEGEDYRQAMEKKRMDPIYIFSPTTSGERMRTIADCGTGFIYCVARKGVTGDHTAFSQEMDQYLARCRQATDLPLALGFGVKDRTDIDFLRGKADIAVIGTQTIRIVEQQGAAAVGDFIRGLRD